MTTSDVLEVHRPDGLSDEEWAKIKDRLDAFVAALLKEFRAEGDYRS